MKKPNGHEIIRLFESFSPKHLAVEGDPIGLQIGDPSQKINKVLIALDVTEEVVDEAIELRANMIIAHHPLIYSPLKKVISAQPAGRIVTKLIKHDIVLYIAHTNLDIAEEGVNDLLANALELNNPAILRVTYTEPVKKLAVFVPEGNAEAVREAIGNAGAGSIGDYSHCTYSLKGIGRFLPNQKANPYIGQPGKMEMTEETRVEAVFPASIEKKVIKAMLQSHPYEEVAYDIFSIENKGRDFGLGRVGELEKEMTLKDFAEKVKSALEVDTVRVIGNLTNTVKKVAVLGGDGNKYVRDAQFTGADVFVSGDLYYHTALDFKQEGMNMIDPGHNVEKIMKKGVANKMGILSENEHFEVEYIASTINTDPFEVM